MSDYNHEQLRKVIRFYKMKMKDARSSEEERSDAMFNYATMLYNDDNIRLNKKKAAKYYKMATDLGNPAGMIFYASMIKNGYGLLEDEGKSNEYFDKAKKTDSPFVDYYYNIIFSRSVLARLNNIGIDASEEEEEDISDNISSANEEFSRESNIESNREIV